MSEGDQKNPDVQPQISALNKTDVIGDTGAVVDTSAGPIALPDQVLPSNLFVLPVNSAVVYPTLMAPIMVSVKKFMGTVEETISRQRVVGLLLTQDKGVSAKTKTSELHTTGVVVKIMKRLKMPDGTINLLVHSLKRFEVKRVLSEHPHIVVEAKYLEDKVDKGLELDAYSRSVISQVKTLSEMNPFFTEEMRLAMLNAPGPGVVADLVAFALSLPKKEAQEFLETIDVKERFQRLLVKLQHEKDVAELQKKIQDDVNTKINTMQREFFLKEQLKAIKKELKVEEDDKSKSSREFRERIDASKMPEEAKKVALEELEKFETLSEQSPEYNVSRSYLETITTLPWGEETEDNLDLKHAQEVLDSHHYGLEKVKERIIQFLAVRQLKTKREDDDGRKGSIICLVGPPGVGKTSIGKSIAETMQRKFYRFSLGGMRDEAEIKGHRRTYIGAMPGKIMQAIKRAGSQNAVLMLDEIDKLGASFQGDPASALLEVLDPEQNAKFVDHYLDVPFDLSNVLFIATANSLSTIPGPLLDRMEIIELPGYTLEEKKQIASKYVIPQVLKENGLTSKQLKVPSATLVKLLRDYAREPGLRSLQKLVGKIARKAAIEVVKKKGRGKPILVQEKDLTKWVGPQRFYNELAERIKTPGVVVGLAWTSMGGDILFIEAAKVPGSGQLRLTGQMGDVMSESANIAWSFVKKRLAEEGRFKKDDFKDFDIHLHIPAGAIPKDGPSAGVTMASALYSLITDRPAEPLFAMTGELTLTGKVLPVGGIKEKILAANRAGIKTVLLPELNRKDLAEVPPYALKGLKLKWASNIDQVFAWALKNGARKSETKAKKKRKR